MILQLNQLFYRTFAHSVLIYSPFILPLLLSEAQNGNPSLH